MANPFNRDIKGIYGLIKKTELKEYYQADTHRLVEILSGYGTSKTRIGADIYVRFLCSDQECHFSSFDLERLVEGNELKKLTEWATLFTTTTTNDLHD